MVKGSVSFGTQCLWSNPRISRPLPVFASRVLLPMQISDCERSLTTFKRVNLYVTDRKPVTFSRSGDRALFNFGSLYMWSGDRWTSSCMFSATCLALLCTLTLWVKCSWTLQLIMAEPSNAKISHTYCNFLTLKKENGLKVFFSFCKADLFIPSVQN